MRSSVVCVAVLTSLTLLGSAGAVPAAYAERARSGSSAARPNDPHPLSDLRVEGIVVADTAGGNRAIISDAKKRTENLYSAGDVIRGLTITEISEKGVVLKGADDEETLILKKAAGGMNQAPLPDDVMISFDFDNVDVRVAIKFVSDLTGTNFIIDDDVRGTITVICPHKIPVSEAMNLLESILEVKGYAMVPSGDVVKIMTKREATQRSVPLVVPDGKEPPPTGDEIVTRMFKLEHADAGSIRRTLGQLLPKDTSVTVYPATNTLIITDTATNINRLAGIIEQLDRPGETVPIRRLIKKYSDLSGQNVVVGPHVGGCVMFNVPDEIPKDEYLAALKAVIEVSGCKMEQVGSFITIKQVTEPQEEEKEETGGKVRSGPKRSDCSS